LEEHRRPGDRDRGVHRLVQSPTAPRRDRHDPARRARGHLPSPPDRAGTRRRGTCEPLTNPGRFKPGWLTDMVEAELLAAEREEYRAIARHHHLVFRREG